MKYYATTNEDYSQLVSVLRVAEPPVEPHVELTDEQAKLFLTGQTSWNSWQIASENGQLKLVEGFRRPSNPSMNPGLKLVTARCEDPNFVVTKQGQAFSVATISVPDYKFDVEVYFTESNNPTRLLGTLRLPENRIELDYDGEIDVWVRESKLRFKRNDAS